MQLIFQVHRIFGEMILPLVIVGVAIYMTVVYKPGAPRGIVSLIFPILVDLQVGLGIIYWLSLLTIPALQDRYLGMPFILHPILGIIAAGLGHMAVGAKNPLRTLGRWAPLASLGVLLVLVLSNIMLVAMPTA
ncbi:hypothetical protein OSCT_0781 [Oscillochloris trichoides DG-6]|uniref:Uncharacterized protein n=1 Tax=Oscillochloris trichoides DG-6 TaxID=765420 RepID=E1IBT0_9CHLR|nr:hypothetical protein [Oscillochloris trichoides]EFO81382.1 hypothetical protein OSCT_0781 [Oscillochloris trichoides DG-6]